MLQYPFQQKIRRTPRPERELFRQSNRQERRRLLWLQGVVCCALPMRHAQAAEIAPQITLARAKRHRMTEEQRVLRERIVRLETNLPDETKMALGMGN